MAMQPFLVFRMSIILINCLNYGLFQHFSNSPLSYHWAVAFMFKSGRITFPMCQGSRVLKLGYKMDLQHV